MKANRMLCFLTRILRVTSMKTKEFTYKSTGPWSNPSQTMLVQHGINPHSDKAQLQPWEDPERNILFCPEQILEYLKYAKHAPILCLIPDCASHFAAQDRQWTSIHMWGCEVPWLEITASISTEEEGTTACSTSISAVALNTEMAHFSITVITQSWAGMSFHQKQYSEQSFSLGTVILKV